MVRELIMQTSHSPILAFNLSKFPIPIIIQSRIFSPVENRFQTRVPMRYNTTATLNTSSHVPETYHSLCHVLTLDDI